LTISGIYYIIPDITINRKDEQMDTIDKSIKELVATAKIASLLEIKNKIQEEIDELEKQKVGEDDIPF
tara:strand:- start:62 stop:265 length:204 start_codon:yes stop_codon:yes gene_type:complete